MGGIQESELDRLLPLMDVDGNGRIDHLEFVGQFTTLRTAVMRTTLYYVYRYVQDIHRLLLSQRAASYKGGELDELNSWELSRVLSGSRGPQSELVLPKGDLENARKLLPQQDVDPQKEVTERGPPIQPDAGSDISKFTVELIGDCEAIDSKGKTWELMPDPLCLPATALVKPSRGLQDPRPHSSITTSPRQDRSTVNEIAHLQRPEQENANSSTPEQSLSEKRLQQAQDEVAVRLREEGPVVAPHAP